MKRRDFLHICATLVASQTAAGQNPDDTLRRDRRRILDLHISDLLEKHQVPGLSYTRISNGYLEFSKGYGIANTETGQAVDASTVFEAASLTKPLLAQVVMKLWEDQYIDLDLPLVEYLPPQLDTANPKRFNAITATHVLTHTTGLPNWHNGSRPVRLRFDPGTKFSYSGMAYVYLQRVVEHITRVPLERYLQKNLFDDLRMDSASLVWRDDYDTRLAYGHNPNGTPSRQRVLNSNAASSLVCNAQDYARFIQLLLNILPKSRSGLNLKQGTLDHMLTPQSTVAENISWGLGWGIQESKSGNTYWHWGSNGNRYNSFVVWDRKKKDAVVIMTNSGNGLNLCKELVPHLMKGPHPAFDWKMVVR